MGEPHLSLQEARFICLLQMQPSTPLAAVRKTPEVILWAVAIFVCGVVVLPLCHLVGHADDHAHGGSAAHLLAHAAGGEHELPVVHGEGDGLHFGLALLEAEAPSLVLPESGGLPTVVAVRQEAPPRRSLRTPLQPGAP
jgi:hypothetical protein